METNGFSGGKQCVFTPANDNSYVPTAVGSYVWKATKVAVSDASYPFMTEGHAGNSSSILKGILITTKEGSVYIS